MKASEAYLVLYQACLSGQLRGPLDPYSDQFVEESRPPSEVECAAAAAEEALLVLQKRWPGEFDEDG